MKKRYLLTIAALLALLSTALMHAGDGEVIRLSEPTEVADGYEAFGSPLPAFEGTVKISELVANSEQYQDQQVVVETRIAKVCQKKGCFFIATEGADSVRVSFTDYSFFIPTDSGGKTVTLAGTFKREAVSDAQAKHLAEDLGEDAPASPSAFEYSIVASGVRIGKG